MIKDIVGGFIILAISAFYYLQSMNIRRSTMADEVGAHGVPQAFAAVLGILSILLIARTLFTRFKMAERPAMTADEWAILKLSVLRMLGMLGIGIAYLVLVSTLGYALSIGLLLAAVMVYQGLALSWRVALVAAGGTAVLWIIFVLLLDIPLPAGIWARWV
jgi:cell division protein FtsW (lipid II flippase)